MTVKVNAFVAEPYDSSHLQLFSMSEKTHFNSSGRYFCLLPYNEKKKTSPQFFQINGRELISTGDNNEIHPGIQLQAAISKADYIKKVAQLKKEIQQGNIYEINYCMEFYSENVVIDPVPVFARLHALTKAPYCKLVKIGEDYIISASPELFLKRSGDLLSTKPIKGTIRRGVNKNEDEVLKEQLQNSIKERTENVMAVDVARNDLSRIAKRGTVNVNKLYNIESFETVHQMVSTVSCELKQNTSLDEIINSTFPMASMTGAPKRKAMEFIEQTECFTRNFYSGAMGFIEESGDFELSVNIRSIFYNTAARRLSIAVGSAITHLCDPEQEYDECLLKANAMLKALNATIKDS